MIDQFRDRALFDLAIGSKLRGYDLVMIKIGDLVVVPNIRTRAIVVQILPVAKLWRAQGGSYVNNWSIAPHPQDSLWSPAASEKGK